MSRAPLAPADALRLVLCVAAIMCTAWLGVGACFPPRPLAADASATDFSAGRAMETIRAIAMRPHPVGTPEHDRVAATLLARLKALGLIAEERRYLVDEATMARIAQWSGGRLHPSELADIIGVLPGRDRTRPALLLMAHYDTVWGSPGAADDSAGVASVIEVVRALAARGSRARDVVVLLTDGEETGLSGARAFFAGGGLAGRVGVVVNLETRGAGGRATMFETGDADGAMIALFARAAADPVGNSLAALAYSKMPNRTDFTVSREHGLPGFNFAFSGRAAYYHSPLATVDRVDPGSVQDMGRQALAIGSALATADALPPRTRDATFFDLLGRRLVHYPSALGWLVILGAALALGAAAMRQRPAPGHVLAGIDAGLWLLAHGLLGLVLFNQLSGAGRSANYYDRLAALPRLEAQGVLVLLGLGLVALSLRAPRLRVLGAVPGLLLGLFALKLHAPGGLVWPAMLVAMASGALAPRRGVGGWGGWIGLIALVDILAVATQVAAAPAAWLFAWPGLVLGLAAAAVARIGPRPATLVVAAVSAVAVSAPLVPLAHLAMLGLGASMPAILLLVVPALLAAFWPLARMRFDGAVAIAAAACLIVAAAIALQVRFDGLAPSVPAYSLAD